MKSFKQYRSTLRYHDKLNPSFWKDDKLDTVVRMKLLQIADVWKEFANVPAGAVKDIILLGGNANYNYTKLSDLDVHLVVDYDKMDCDKELVFDYFMAKKSLWASSHKVTVYKQPVELFAEPVDTVRKIGQGIYSLKNDKWIQKPEFQNLDFESDDLLSHKVEFYTQEIENAIEGRVDMSVADDLKNRIYSMRAAAIQKEGEFSFENLVFKELRNRGLIDKLRSYLSTNKDKQLSLR
jgi:hypothetical protein